MISESSCDDCSAPLSLCFIIVLAGFIEIQHPYYPALYVKGGEDFNLTCMGNDVDLLWFRTTNDGNEEEIKATKDSEYKMTLIKEVPSMNVRNILVKKNARITDSGKYTCSDRAQTDQYPITVTVLYSKYLPRLLTQTILVYITQNCYVTRFRLDSIIHFCTFVLTAYQGSIQVHSIFLSFFNFFFSCRKI